MSLSKKSVDKGGDKPRPYGIIVGEGFTPIGANLRNCHLACSPVSSIYGLS